LHNKQASTGAPKRNLPISFLNVAFFALLGRENYHWLSRFFRLFLRKRTAGLCILQAAANLVEHIEVVLDVVHGAVVRQLVQQ